MNAEIVTGYVGQVLNECELDSKAIVLLSKLYNEALSESKRPLNEDNQQSLWAKTHYDKLIKLPPEEFAKWICCPDMFDDNFKKPDCDISNCTACCLKYLLSSTDSEDEDKKQPYEVANDKSNYMRLLFESLNQLKDAIDNTCNILAEDSDKN